MANYLFYKVLFIPLSLTMEYEFNWAFLFSYLESFRMSLQNRWLITKHAISLEALTEMPLCVSIPLFLMQYFSVNEKITKMLVPISCFYVYETIKHDSTTLSCFQMISLFKINQSNFFPSANLMYNIQALNKWLWENIFSLFVVVL